MDGAPPRGPVLFWAGRIFYLCVLCGEIISVEPWKRNLYTLWATEFIAALGMALVLPFYIRELGVTELHDVGGGGAFGNEGGYFGWASSKSLRYFDRRAGSSRFNTPQIYFPFQVKSISPW